MPSSVMAATVRCNVFGGSQARGAFALWWVVMLALGTSMAAGVPAPLAVALIFVAAYVGLRRLAGTATYALEGNRISRQYQSFSGTRSALESCDLHELTAWKFDHTLSRGFERFEYLELDHRDGPRWVITSRQDAAGFAAFKESFVAALAREQLGGRALPRQRPTFYRTWHGRGVTVLLSAGTVGLLLAAVGGLVAVTGLIKLGIFIVPGSLYLLWRSFGPKT